MKTMLVLLALTVMTSLVGCSSRTPDIPFAGLRQKAVLYDNRSEYLNGDCVYLREYQLEPVDVSSLSSSKDAKWVRGPIKDARYSGAFFWCTSADFPASGWDYDQWIESKDFYFYLKDYEGYDGKPDMDIPHHSAIWVLDTANNRLYYVAGSQ